MTTAAGEPRDEDGQGHLAIVTGASRGLGRALSVAFAQRGVQVVGMARRADALEETGRLCRQGAFSHYVADVSDPARVREVVSEVETRIGPVTILFNNAAVYPRVDFLSAPAERILEQLAVNLNGYVNCASAVLPGMAARGHGSIVNVSSFAGCMPIPGSLGYSVSKGGVRVLTQSIVAETRDRLPGVVVSEWIPGILDTGMGESGGIDPAVAAQWGVSLALGATPDLHGATFLQNREMLAPRSRMRRVKDCLLGIPPPRPRQL